MSSYRSSYAPWKSNLSSYRSDRFSTDDKPKFGSITTPSSYRPSYSVTSGTYRSVPIKKENLLPTYSKYSSTTSASTNNTTPTTNTSSVIKDSSKDVVKDSKKDEKNDSLVKNLTSKYDLTKETKIKSKNLPSSTSITSKYGSAKDLTNSKYESNKDLSSKPSITSSSKYSLGNSLSSTKYGSLKDINSSISKVKDTTSSATSKYGSTKDLNSSESSKSSTSSKYGTSIGKTKKDDGPPITYNTRYTKISTTRSRDPSPAVDSKRNTTSSSSSLLTSSKIRCRDPSPANNKKQPLSIAKTRSRDPSPIDSKLSNLSISNRIRSRDPSPATESKLAHIEARIRSRDPSPADNRTYNYNFPSPNDRPGDSKIAAIEARIRSRDPSPATENRSSTYMGSRIRSRDPSPVDHGIRRSRDPSPSDHYGSTNGYPTYNYKTLNRTNSNASSSASSKFNSSIPKSTAVEKALSYLSASEARSRSASVNRNASQSKSESFKLEPVKQEIIKPKINTTPIKSVVPNPTTLIEAVQRLSTQEIKPKPKPQEKEEEEEEEYEEVEEEEETEEEVTEEEEESSEEEIAMISVEVTTRGTSPTPPSSSNFLRARRADMAKTIDKTITRPAKKPAMCDKSIQSDRLDDTTRYSKFANSSAKLQMSNYLDSKYPTSYSRYSSPRYSSISSRDLSSRDSLSRNSSIRDQENDNSQSDISQRSTSLRSESKSQTSISNNKKEEKEKINVPLTKSESLSRSNTSKSIELRSNNSKLDSKESNLLAPSSLKLQSPPKLISNIKQNLNDSSISHSDSNKDLPPLAPKAESPAKTVSLGSSSNLPVKWPNKDFRKSALNMGTPDRPRQSRNNSTSSDVNDENMKGINNSTRSIRSPSIGSESSASSALSVEEDSQFNVKAKSASRTSLMLSSADELPLDRSSCAVTQNDTSQRNEEAKSFLIRTLGPVTHMFKTQRPPQDTPDKNWLDSNNSTSISESIKLDTEPVYDASHGTNNSVPFDQSQAFDKKYNLRHIDSGEKAWWMNSSSREENVGSPKINISENSPKILNGSAPHTPEIIRINLHRIESGEKAWWLNSNSKSNENQQVQQNSSNSTSNEIPSWWLSSNSNEKLQNNQENCIKEHDIPPLGDRASPEGLEDTSSARKSIYDNIPNVQNDQIILNSNQNSNNTNLNTNSNTNSKNSEKLFISRHTNIDDILGGSCHVFSPIESVSVNEIFEEITPDMVRIHDSTAHYMLGKENCDVVDSQIQPSTINPVQLPEKSLDDAALQIYKEGDYGAYLDLESSLAEQAEEIEGLTFNRKNSLVVRTQLSVRVHAIIEKLLTCEGRDLRRALFSLKQIFQEDKDLVHGFVALGGLSCLVRVGSNADQNYQNYILRALGQVMLYVDGMNGVMKHGPTIEWLYSLIASRYRLVVKTALKLLLVFVEYVENNCQLLVKAIHTVDEAQGTIPWSNIMRLLKDYENADTELLIYATSLINKTLSGLNDQDSFYDESDFLEQQGMESVVQRYMSRTGTDLDLLDQLQLYEAVLKFEDGETDGIRIPDSSIRKTLRLRSNVADCAERRKSRRHSTGTAPSLTSQFTPAPAPPPPPPPPPPPGSFSSPMIPFSQNMNGVLRECREKSPRENVGVTPGLRRRRERAERQKTFMKEQQEAQATGLRPFNLSSDSYDQELVQKVSNGITKYYQNGNHHNGNNTHISNNRNNNKILNYNQNIISNGFNNNNNNNISNINNNNNNDSKFTLNKEIILENDHEYIENNNNTANIMNNNKNIDNDEKFKSKSKNESIHKNHKKFENDTNLINEYYNKMNVRYNNNNNNMDTKIQNGHSNGYVNGCQNGFTNGYTNGYSNGHTKTQCDINKNGSTEINGTDDLESEDSDKKLLLQLKRDHTVKDLTQKLSNIPMSPQEEKSQNRIGDMSGLISKAKEGLAKSRSKGDISRSPSADKDLKKMNEPKKSENELHWEELVKNMTRPLKLCDLDFTDLLPEDEIDVLSSRGMCGAIPPPPPPIGFGSMAGGIPPPHIGIPPPRMLMNGSNGLPKMNGDANTIKKNKKTVKLFWKEIREDMIPPTINSTIWDELPQTNVDIQKLEHLFESRAKDLMTKKQQELNKNKEIIILDHKRSNAINIAMTKLPPPRAIKAAILKMDATVVTREGIDKLLNMLPTEEERGKIQEAQMANPELPLGSAENFLLTLSSISELAARLKLWSFKLDFENIEKEIAEPLMDLKQGLELLKENKTFRSILSTLLSIGIFLNGAYTKGFQIEYLAKVPEVKDTVHKHSLLHHLCHMVMETSSDTTDLYSEIGPITRASKADFTELAQNISYLETECKASWDRLKLISKHDCPPQLHQKLVDFLADCAERIIILDMVHKRVINRYRKFLLWLGMPQHRVSESKPNEICRIISEFALEYRTTRERVQQQMEKKANHRERNKTRGKMIIDVGKFKSKEDTADAELRQILRTSNTSGPVLGDTSGNLSWNRRRRSDHIKSPGISRDESFTDGDDEILESLVKTATKTSGQRPTPRERKRTRHADRKSLKRSRTREGFPIEQTGTTMEV